MYHALTVAGSDSGGGAGIQADLKTFAALGVYGTSVVTAITAQNTLGVTHIHNVPQTSITAQLDAVLTDIGTGAMKSGMLPTSGSIRAVVAAVRKYGIRNLVVDPVMFATSGQRLQTSRVLRTVRTELLPLALVVTPNIAEAEALSGLTIRAYDDLLGVATAISKFGPRYVLIKGGHLPGEPIDYLFDGGTMQPITSGPRVDTPHTHGTGCTYSAAIAAGLARGCAVDAAVVSAKQYIAGALRSAFAVGAGRSGVHHFFASWPGKKGTPVPRGGLA